MQGELSRLAARIGLKQLVQQAKSCSDGGAIEMPFNAQIAQLAVHYHRTSARVLWEFAESDATRLEPLYEELYRCLAENLALDRPPFLGNEVTFSIASKNLEHIEAGDRQVVGVIKNVIIDLAETRSWRMRVDPDAPNLLFDVRCVDNKIKLSLDLVRRPHHLHGYRRRTVAAPLREDLAAGLLMLARYDSRDELLVDLFAGSGTILAEAHGLATASPIFNDGFRPTIDDIAPRLGLEPIKGPLFADATCPLAACEPDRDAQSAIAQNLQACGAQSSVLALHPGRFEELTAADLEQLLESSGKKRGLILSNPPYGLRLGEDAELRQSFQALGQLLESLLQWRAAFIISHDDFEKELRYRARVKKPLSNGPIRAQFMLFD